MPEWLPTTEIMSLADFVLALYTFLVFLLIWLAAELLDIYNDE